MIWRKLFGRERTVLPAGSDTIVLLDAADTDAIEPFLRALEAKFGRVALATFGESPALEARPVFSLAPDEAELTLKKAGAQRIIIFGDAPLSAADIKVFRINARAAHEPREHCFTSDPQLADQLGGAMLTGDPLAGLASLPQLANGESCERFREQRQSGRWIGYFAGTGENEEPQAYKLFNRLIRHKMGLMLLAPFAPERCEPVYRDAIKYRLQTIRHNRLSTSFVPIKTRVYYIEEDAPRNALYACADWVVPGGSLSLESVVEPDIIAPILHARPLVLGEAVKMTPLIRAALRDDIIDRAADEEQLFECLKAIIDDPDRARERAQRAKAWLQAQVGALERVLAAID